MSYDTLTEAETQDFARRAQFFARKLEKLSVQMERYTFKTGCLYNVEEVRRNLDIMWSHLDKFQSRLLALELAMTTPEEEED